MEAGCESDNLTPNCTVLRFWLESVDKAHVEQLTFSVSVVFPENENFRTQQGRIRCPFLECQVS